jgi:hypothetical protein
VNVITTLRPLKEGLFEWLKFTRITGTTSVSHQIMGEVPKMASSSSNTIFGYPADVLNAFDAAYVASLPPALQQLMATSPANLPDGTNPRLAKAADLALQGYVIDKPIMAWGWDPFMTMSQRAIDGFTTVMDGLNQVSIKVSTDLADYPPYPVPTVDPNAQYIDRPIGGIAYNGAAWFPTKLTITSKLSAGTEMVFQGHTFTLHVTTSQTQTQTQFIYVWLQISD